ncbi:hypothetical protein QTO34_006998 [Cnephaeus nilssonii]|uniref:PINIT domain-containing protein n=1 Tax=Cnephaeus nilssonii TaxID=3371016 RepID=A0AA40LH05_CNENI|nr:hypothetical protein QTO34_006998 [Eptesicus nilssonii]
MPLVQTVVQLKTLPFYEVPDVLIKPMSSKQYSTISREVFIFGLTFQLERLYSPSSAETLLGRNKLSSEGNYLNSLCIKVNGKLFTLPGYAPPPKNEIEQRHPGRPMNITCLVRLFSPVPNQSSISWASEIGKLKKNLLQILIVKPPQLAFSVLMLLFICKCMRRSPPGFVLCVTKKKQKKTAYERLILDGLFMEILSDCSDVDEIKFQEDGSWCPMRQRKKL